MMWSYQDDLRDEEIAEIERQEAVEKADVDGGLRFWARVEDHLRGDAEKTAQVEEDAAERASVEREAQLEAEAEIRDRVARNTARREQSRAQSSTDEL